MAGEIIAVPPLAFNKDPNNTRMISHPARSHDIQNYVLKEKP